MKKYIVLTFILFLYIFSFSQNQIVMKIWSSYNQAKSIVQAQKDGDIPEDHYQLTLNQNLPAIGPQSINYEIYFSLIEKYDDPDYFEDYGEYYDQEVFLIEKSYNIAGQKFYEEFLYEDEKLIFYFYKEIGDNCNEVRIYLQNDKLIRFSKTELNSDDCETISSQVEYTINNLPNEFNETVDLAITQANNLIKIFDSLNAY